MKVRERKELVRDLKQVAQEMNHKLDLVFVEGKNDKKALRQLGLEVEIVKASRFKPSLLQGSEQIAILTDFDHEGQKLRKTLLERLQTKAEVDKRFRKKVGKLLGHYGRRDIEAINNLLRTKS